MFKHKWNFWLITEIFIFGCKKVAKSKRSELHQGSGCWALRIHLLPPSPLHQPPSKRTAVKTGCGYGNSFKAGVVHYSDSGPAQITTSILFRDTSEVEQLLEGQWFPLCWSDYLCPGNAPQVGGWSFDPDVQPSAYRLGQHLLRHSSGYEHGI